MPYHIKRTGTVLNTSKVVYYKGEDRWTDTYDDRKVYSVKATADAEITNARESTYLKRSQVITLPSTKIKKKKIIILLYGIE